MSCNSVTVTGFHFPQRYYKMPMNSGVVLFFFSSKRFCKAHTQRNEAKGSFAKIVGEKGALIAYLFAVLPS